MFSSTECTIVGTQNHAVKGKGTMSNGLYHFSTSAIVIPHSGQQSFVVLNPTLVDEYTIFGKTGWAMPLCPN